MSLELRGKEAERGSRRSAAPADTRALHPEPRVSSGGAVANPPIRHACEYLRRPAADIGSLARGIPCMASRRIAPSTTLRASARG